MPRKPMKSGPSDAALSIRVPATIIARADALIPALAAEGIKHGQTHASRSLVIKAALEAGLSVLEQKHGKSR